MQCWHIFMSHPLQGSEAFAGEISKGSYKPSPPHHHPFVFLYIRIFLCVLLTLCLCSPPAPRGGVSRGLARPLSCFIVFPLHSLETSQSNLFALY